MFQDQSALADSDRVGEIVRTDDEPRQVKHEVERDEMHSNAKFSMRSDTQIHIGVPMEHHVVVPCFCFDLGHLSERLQFLVLTTLIMVFFLVYGYMQEWIFHQDGMRDHGWYLTLVQFAFYAVISYVEMSYNHQSRKMPLLTYGFLALCQLTTMGFSNASLGFLNYPTQVIFKCCKLIPVLIGGIIIQGKRYGALDFSAALLMSIGLALFTLADSQVSPKFDPTGVLMISMALVADAVLGNMQEKTMKQYSSSNSEVIFYSYAIGFAYLLSALSLSGYLVPGSQYFAQNPTEKYGSALVFSISGYFGMQIILTFVRRFGAFVTVTVTSFRKVLSIVISFLAFAKPFTMAYVYSGFLVLLGIYINLLSKNQRHVSFSLLVMAVVAKIQRILPGHRSSKQRSSLSV